MASAPDMDIDFVTSICCAEMDSFCMEHGELEESIEAKEASVKARSLYDAGVALFSKEAIRDIVRQLNSNSQTITIQGFNAEPVTFRRKSGQTMMAGEEHDWIIGNPFIRFLSIQALCSHTHGYAPGLSLCSIWIYHYLIKRRILTNELVLLTPRRSRDEVLGFFRMQREVWMSSDHCKELHSLLRAKSTCTVTKIIAFACSGMTSYDEESSAARSAYQHALILTLRDVLTETQNPSDPIKCYAQDPIYSKVDREVLDSNGICILDHPHGFLEVDDSTVVLSFAPNIPVRQVVAEISRPAMMIWDECICLANGFEGVGSTDPDSPRLINMIQNQYDDIDFPGCLEAFDGMKIYIRNRNPT